MIDWLLQAAPSKRRKRNFSLEAVVVGRNDDYEPNWTAKLFASLRHNRRMFEGSGVDFRVAFVEWNPPQDRLLLADSILEQFHFARVVLVDPAVHEALCGDSGLQIMMNFAYNAALRTGLADFSLITAGDEFFGSSLVRKIASEGLEFGCLYRAERVNVRRDLDFINAPANVIEAPENVVSVDASTDPPYTNACGDFLLTDTGTMQGLRGFDESIKNARLHLDSRFAVNAMLAGASCEMLGQIFHIDHARSFRNTALNYPGQAYRWESDLPYVNGDNWGLGDFTSEQVGDRLMKVTLPRTSRRSNGAFAGRSKVVLRRLRSLLHVTQPESAPKENVDRHALRLEEVTCYPHWESRVALGDGKLTLETSDKPWCYAATLPLKQHLGKRRRWYWVAITAAIEQGAIGVAFLNDDDELIGERYLPVAAMATTSIPVPQGARDLLFRNAATEGQPSKAVLSSLALVSHAPHRVDA